MAGPYRIKMDYSTLSNPTVTGYSVEITYYCCLVLDSENKVVKKFRANPENPKNDYEAAQAYLLGAGGIINDQSIKHLFDLLDAKPEERDKLVGGKITPHSRS